MARAPLLLLILLLTTLSQERAAAAAAAAAAYACDQSNATLRAFPFCNTSLPMEIRVSDYVSRLTLEEKVTHLVSTAIGVPRLGVPTYEWWGEALHGLGSAPATIFGGPIFRTTIFPMPIASAASFNTTLFHRMGQVASTEARAMHNTGQSGLTFWSPNSNIVRDPRWGRAQETSGEDPILTSVYAINYVRGLQESPFGADKLKVSACCKHMTAYDMEFWMGHHRYDFNAIVTEQDLVDTFNAPFKSCVQEGAASCVMCSYNRLNGVPTCADHKLLTETVRENWKLNGYIASDRDSVQVFYEFTNYAASPEEAAADALLAGVNLNSGTFLRNYTRCAIERGKLKEEVVDKALKYSTTVQMRLGLFDGDPREQPYGTLGPADVCTESSQQLALEAAQQATVLLKNSGNTLPLSTSKVSTVAVVGPHANASIAMMGTYYGVPCKETTPYQGLQRYAKQVLLAPGCENVSCSSTAMFRDAEAAASRADAVVLIMGLDRTQEDENQDRLSLLLPGQQQALVSRVAGAAQGRPVILVLFCSGSVDVSFAVNDSRIAAIIWAGYPGEAGGAALADIIFGAYNPGGKLPTSWYHESYTELTMLDMNMRPNVTRGYPGRTYRFYTGNTLYDFGYGLSYTNLTFKFVKAPSTLLIPDAAPLIRSCNPGAPSRFHVDANHGATCRDLVSTVLVDVYNGGNVASSEAVLVFSTPPGAGVDGVPRKQLAAFQRVYVRPLSTSTVSFHLDPCKHLSHGARGGQLVLSGGEHTLSVSHATHRLSILAGSSLTHQSGMISDA